MLKSGYFRARFLSSFHFEGGVPKETGQASFFRSQYFRPRVFSALQYFSKIAVAPPKVTLEPTSIAIEVIPSTVSRNSPIVVIAYVYDQYNKAMENIRIDFSSSSPLVLNTPSYGFSDSMGRVVKTTNTSSQGVTNLSAFAGDISAYVTVTVSSAGGGSTSTLTHGATIQAGSSGGGSAGPIRVSLSRKINRWPTR